MEGASQSNKQIMNVLFFEEVPCTLSERKFDFTDSILLLPTVFPPSADLPMLIQSLELCDAEPGQGVVVYFLD